jgi:hypothetical protein
VAVKNEAKNAEAGPDLTTASNDLVKAALKSSHSLDKVSNLLQGAESVSYRKAIEKDEAQAAVKKILLKEFKQGGSGTIDLEKFASAYPNWENLMKDPELELAAEKGIEESLKGDDESAMLDIGLPAEFLSSDRVRFLVEKALERKKKISTRYYDRGGNAKLDAFQAKLAQNFSEASWLQEVTNDIKQAKKDAKADWEKNTKGIAGFFRKMFR